LKYIGPLKELKKQKAELEKIITELEKQPPRILDIAYERIQKNHRFKILKIEGSPKKDKKWRQVERIICKTKCSKCPHGDFWYRYSKRKDGSLNIKLLGEYFFDFEVVQKMMKEAKKIKPQIGDFVVINDDEKRGVSFISNP